MKRFNCYIGIFFSALVGCSKEDECFKSQMYLWHSTPLKSYEKCANKDVVYKEKFIPGYQKVYIFQGCGEKTYDPLPDFKSDALDRCTNK